MLSLFKTVVLRATSRRDSITETILVFLERALCGAAKLLSCIAVAGFIWCNMVHVTFLYVHLKKKLLARKKSKEASVICSFGFSDHAKMPPLQTLSKFFEVDALFDGSSSHVCKKIRYPRFCSLKLVSYLRVQQ